MDQKREESREIIDWMSYHADRVTKFMIGIMMVMMITIVLFGVLNRFIFKIPLSWTEEVSRYLMIWVSMLGAAVAVRAGTHVGVSLFIEKLRHRSKNAVIFFNQAVIVAFTISLVVLGIRLCIRQIDQLGYVTRISMFWPFLSIPVGGLMILVQLFYAIRLLLKGRPPAADHAE